MSIAVLFSGGVDSSVVAVQTGMTGALKLLIFVDYGQAAAEYQESVGREFATFLGCEFRALRYDYKRHYAGKPLPKVFVAGSLPMEHTRDDLTNNCNQLSDMEDFCWLEGRNALFMQMASIEAIYAGCTRLFTGFQYNAIEQRINDDPVIARGRDTTRHIIDTMNLCNFQGFSKPFRIESPLQGLYKHEIMQLAGSIIPEGLLAKTHSCEYWPPCNICSQCKETATIRRT